MTIRCNILRLFNACLVLLALVVSGCSATGPKLGEMDKQLSVIAADRGRIFFYRDASVFGAAIQPNIFLDGNLVGESRPGGFFFVDVPPGNYVVSAKTEVSTTASIILREGETQYVRSSITMGLLVGRLQFTLVHEQEARQALLTLSYTGSAATFVAPTARSGPQGSPEASTRTVPTSNARPVTLEDLDALLPKKP